MPRRNACGSTYAREPLGQGPAAFAAPAPSVSEKRLVSDREVAGKPQKPTSFPGVPLHSSSVPRGFDGKTQRLLFVDVGGEPRIYEYMSKPLVGDGLRFKLLYPRESGRIYYKKGDLILLGSIKRSDLAKRFPEYKNNPGFFLLLLLLGLEQSEYKTAYQIIDIKVTEASQGKGTALLRNVVFLADDLPPVDLNGLETKARNYDDICTNFIQDEKFSAALEWVSLVVIFATEMTSTVIGGSLKKLASKPAAGLVKKAVRERFKKEAAQAAIELAVAAATAFGITFTKEVTTQLGKVKKPVQDPATKKVKIESAGIDSQFISKALQKASVSAADTLIMGAVEALFSKAAEQLVPKDVVESMVGSARVKLQTYLWSKTLLVTPQIISTSLTAVADALIGSYDEHGNLKSGQPDKEVEKALSEKIKSVYSIQTPQAAVQKLKPGLEAAADYLAEGMFQ